MPSHSAPWKRIPSWGWVLQRLGDTSDLPQDTSVARDSRGWRGHGAAGRRRAARQEPWARSLQAHSPSRCWPEAKQGTIVTPCQGEDTTCGRKSPQDRGKRGLAAPHAARLPKAAASRLSWREMLQGGTAGMSCCSVLTQRGRAALAKATLKAPWEQQPAKADAAARKALRP